MQALAGTYYIPFFSFTSAPYLGGMSASGEKSNPIADAFLAAFGLLRRALGPSNVRVMSEEEARLVQAEFELLERRDRALREKYAFAISRLPELARRAQEHGVAFTLGTAPYRRAAILDFLDNPNAPTDLDITHFTSCYPSPSLPKDEQARMHERLSDLRRALMQRDYPGWTEYVMLSAAPGPGPDGDAARAGAQSRAASAATPPRAERR